MVNEPQSSLHYTFKACYFHDRREKHHNMAYLLRITSQHSLLRMYLLTQDIQ